MMCPAIIIKKYTTLSRRNIEPIINALKRKDTAKYEALIYGLHYFNKQKQNQY